MAIYFKVNGVWTQVQRPFVKIAGVWTPSNSVWRKSGGTWNEVLHYDVTPPAPPLLSLEKVETEYQQNGTTQTGVYIKVGVRGAGSNDSSIRRIRVLTTFLGGAPTTPLGGKYTSKPSDGYPNEPWSDFHFNGFGSSPNNTKKPTNAYYYKNWTLNADKYTKLDPGTYYFGTWAEDFYGNWSTGVFNTVTITKNAGSDVISKEARFQPTATGSWRGTSFVSGDLVQQNSPRSRGLWFYGTQLNNQIGSQGAPTIKSAQIFVQRRNDSGEANANVYLFWHAYPNAGSLGSTLDVNQITKLGQIAKGDAKWFDIPQTQWDHLKDGLFGFGLSYKDPDKAAADANDYSVMKNNSDAPRDGEVHVVWTEKP